MECLRLVIANSFCYAISHQPPNLCHSRREILNEFIFENTSEQRIVLVRPVRFNDAIFLALNASRVPIDVCSIQMCFKSRELRFRVAFPMHNKLWVMSVGRDIFKTDAN